MSLQHQTLDLKGSPSDLRKAFHSLRGGEDIARLLDVPYSTLIYHIYGVPEEKRYKVYRIPKRSGGVRLIHAPATPLVIIQRKLNQILQSVYQPRDPVHGFIHGKSIITNALAHSRKRWVLNLDLENFFPSINFGRVRGMFLATPFRFRSEVATILAQICCFQNVLPQGAPTSPVVANMLCVRLDRELQSLAHETCCFYTRYADDITFSTRASQFPEALAFADETEVRLGQKLQASLEGNGFRANAKKLHLAHSSMHQEVTGLTVNETPNVRRAFVRQIRAMLYAWEKHGYRAAEEHFRKLHDPKQRYLIGEEVSFQAVIRGKLEFLRNVKGVTDPVYRRYAQKFNELSGAMLLPVCSVSLSTCNLPLILTEGKTDWVHLKAALAALQSDGRFKGLEVEFKEFEDPMGDTELLAVCKQNARVGQVNRPLIAIFDRDNPSVVKRVSGSGTPIKDWSGRVYSFAIPVPEHREETPHVCIELYYSDSELELGDDSGRRLFTNREFDPETGFHRTDHDLFCTDQKKLRQDKLAIVDGGVKRRNRGDVSLTKARFASMVKDRAGPAARFRFDAFGAIFQLLMDAIMLDSGGNE